MEPVAKAPKPFATKGNIVAVCFKIGESPRDLVPFRFAVVTNTSERRGVYLSSFPKDKAIKVADELHRRFCHENLPSWSSDQLKEWVDYGTMPFYDWFPPEYENSIANDDGSLEETADD